MTPASLLCYCSYGDDKDLENLGDLANNLQNDILYGEKF
jgi:hypothetical protein